MKNKMSPEQVALSVGSIAGLIVATLVLLISLSQSQIGISALVDAFTAFVISGVLAGLVAWFVQWGRLRRNYDDLAKPGWYDSPEDDGKQWFWSGTRWTRFTRDAPDSHDRIDTVS